MSEYEIYIIPVPSNSDLRGECFNLIDKFPKDITIYGAGIGETTKEEIEAFLQDIVNIAAERRKWKDTTI